MTGTEYAKLLAQIKRHEGAVRDAHGNHVLYRCPAGILTIGYGHNLEAAPIPPAIAARDVSSVAAQGALGAAPGAPGAPVKTASGTAAPGASGTAAPAVSAVPAVPIASATLTPDQAERLLASDVLAVQEKLALHLPWVERLDPARYAVLVNMAFNLGVGGLLAFRNTLSAVRQGDYSSAAAHMLRSRWAAQVGARAKELAGQMCSGEWQ